MINLMSTKGKTSRTIAPPTPCLTTSQDKATLQANNYIGLFCLKGITKSPVGVKLHLKNVTPVEDEKMWKHNHA